MRNLLTRWAPNRKLYELQFMDLEAKMGDDATGWPRMTGRSEAKSKLTQWLSAP